MALCLITTLGLLALTADPTHAYSTAGKQLSGHRKVDHRRVRTVRGPRTLHPSTRRVVAHAAAFAGSTTLTFEEFPVGTTITDDYEAQATT
jgi:hypothetical protein